MQAFTFETGEWGLRVLLITLNVTPLRRTTGWQALARIRRMLGLFAFFYLEMLLLLFFARVPAVAERLAKIRTRSAPRKNDTRFHRPR